VNTSIYENLQDVCTILNEHSVEYLIIGGAAVALHGHERLSKDPSGQDATVVDLDFWFNPTYDNYFRLLNALEKLGEDVSGFREEQAPDPNRSFFRLDRPKFTLDFLPTVPGLQRFREVFIAKETSQLGDVEIPFISYDHLIINKQALGRPKDEEDIRQLQLKKEGQKPPQPRRRQKPR
jgi:predicted nucleotidyltransferase